jgi:hypothetical protein
MTDKLKKFIFKKLSEDLSHAEVILHRGNIWFIDRENKYWYFEFQESGRLFWRWGFFDNFFKLFDMNKDEYEPLITEWFETTINHGVTKTAWNFTEIPTEVLLNRWVKKTMDCGTGMYSQMDLILSSVKPLGISDFRNHIHLQEIFG